MKKTDENPFHPPNAVGQPASIATPVAPARPIRVINLILTSAVGIIIGSCISVFLANMQYPGLTNMHYSGHPTPLHGVFTAVMFSPLSMTLGIYPTLGLGTVHGWLVLPGILLTAFGSFQYIWKGTPKSLAFSLLGFTLWAHNNLLAFNELMSI